MLNRGNQEPIECGALSNYRDRGCECQRIGFSPSRCEHDAASGRADEGSYLVANNGQTGIIEGTPTAFAATTPTLILDNNEDPNNAQAQQNLSLFLRQAQATRGISS